MMVATSTAAKPESAAIELNPKKTAALLRKILRAAFPATKFSVVTERGSMVSSVRISWVDGPTTKRVEMFTEPFSCGSFDGMTDSFNYSKGADRYVVADGQTYRTGTRYIFTQREISPALANLCIKQIAEFWGGVEVIPTAVPNYRGYKLTPEIGNRPVRDDLSGPHYEWFSSIHRAASNRTEFQRAESL